jgi:hypothetical protein
MGRFLNVRFELDRWLELKRVAGCAGDTNAIDHVADRVSGSDS